jgi:hypothetical protein
MDDFFKHLNEPQMESLYKLAKAVRGMHYANIVVRNNGQDVHFEADWLKHLMPLLCPEEEKEFQARLHEALSNKPKPRRVETADAETANPHSSSKEETK